jgi:hypothetical protein
MSGALPTNGNLTYESSLPRMLAALGTIRPEVLLDRFRQQGLTAVPTATSCAEVGLRDVQIDVARGGSIIPTSHFIQRESRSDGRDRMSAAGGT